MNTANKFSCLLTLLFVFQFVFSISSFAASSPSEPSLEIDQGIQEESRANLSNDNLNSMGIFAVSLDPSGFLQFGPSLNAEVGFKNNLVINGHVRIPSWGIMTPGLMTNPDFGRYSTSHLSGIAVGAGLLYFFGHKLSKPYIGGMIEYHSITAEAHQWSQGSIGSTITSRDDDEYTNNVDMVFMAVKGGYRFRFRSGLFINTGAYFGFAVGSDSYSYFYDYNDYINGIYDSGSEYEDYSIFKPSGMIEISIGFEFGLK